MKGGNVFRGLGKKARALIGLPITHDLPDPVLDAPQRPFVPRGVTISWLGLSGGRTDGANQLREWFPNLGKLKSTRDGKPV